MESHGGVRAIQSSLSNNAKIIDLRLSLSLLLDRANFFFLLSLVLSMTLKGFPGRSELSTVEITNLPSLVLSMTVKGSWAMWTGSSGGIWNLYHLPLLDQFYCTSRSVQVCVGDVCRDNKGVWRPSKNHSLLKEPSSR